MKTKLLITHQKNRPKKQKNIFCFSKRSSSVGLPRRKLDLFPCLIK